LGAEFVGAVWIIEGNEPLSELDHLAAEVAALVAAIHIAHQRDLAALEASLGYASVLALLEAETEPAPAALERVALLGFDSRRSYRAVIATLPDDLPSDREGLTRRDRVAERIGRALEARGSSGLLSVALNRVPFLLPAEVGVREFAASIGDAGVGIVAGRAYEGVEGVRRSYRQALSLARYRDRRQICEFDDVLVPRVLAGDEEARRTFVDGFVAPLLKQRGGKSLVEAVVQLARNGFAMKETASKLGIHANTLRYRLTRASETLDLRLDDPNVRFELQLVARLMEIA
jgi:purine catabolism regulator